MTRQPRQRRASGKEEDRLPGTYGGIKELDDVGMKLKAIRNERMKLNQKEAEVQKEALAAMKKLNTNAYHYGEVDLEIVPGKEKISTAAKKEEEE